MGFRSNLREILDFTGMEQKELAAKTGLSLKTIENYVKKDSSIPSADKAVLIAQALGVTVEYLVTGKESAKRETAREVIEIMNILEKLDDYNHEIIVSMAKLLLSFQKKKN
ncbi:MAG: helix-turn-helix domain-containing protein [Treponema sp.]|jgi:transcriptional regulator with XRE-family HTH domain|nr:helix-turn-helix domain-containing protein [Treponema sp.]